ncbi:ribonuclease M5 [Oceanobacillus jeddahense]|uniref:Ribonuclease M5 n=1 Tax=Oceanobacillus jeddahense TaxID=1462527 RepID=A0ABY5JSL5_9BACI|nr:ribonuclease M5 [Oceanobacillus jeddahense]UUI03209.1 ribonuclease M5 [Oceanobacillus jeddahense]
MKIKEMIVVEGRDDTVRIRLAVDADTIETNGSAVNKATLDKIRLAKEKRGVIVFTDPDYPGERIRHLVNQAVPGCKHAFLRRDQAKAKHSRNKSLGIEHASVEDIQKALADVYELADVWENDITKENLINYGLIGGKEASGRRKRLGELLHIGHTNGKQLLKRLTQFQISKEQVDKAMEIIEQEEQDD